LPEPGKPVKITVIDLRLWRQDRRQFLITVRLRFRLGAGVVDSVKACLLMRASPS
jgi:hypothetical protein